MAQLPNDIVIWENQVFVDPPALTAEETRAFTGIRRWARTFYAADCEHAADSDLAQGLPRSMSTANSGITTLRQ
jgi:3-Ketosteroid 9alpha-hydroxylase C-terminal domain